MFIKVRMVYVNLVHHLSSLHTVFRERNDLNAGVEYCALGRFNECQLNVIKEKLGFDVRLDLVVDLLVGFDPISNQSTSPPLHVPQRTGLI